MACVRLRMLYNAIPMSTKRPLKRRKDGKTERPKDVSKTHCLRMTDAQHAAFEAAARADGRTLSAWLRRLGEIAVGRT